MSALFSDPFHDIPLRIDDPEQQVNLVDTVPEDAKLLGLRNVYAIPRGERRSRMKVRCAVCHRRIHWKGFTGELVGGALFLAGSHCGREMFGVDFGDAERDLKRKLERVHEFERRRAFELVATSLLAGLESWRAPLDAMNRSRAAFSRDHGEAYSVCQVAALKNDGAMTVTRRILDHAKMQSDPGGGRVYQYVEARVGTVAGAGYLKPFNPDEVIRAGIQAVKDLSRTAGVVQQSTSTLRSARLNAEERIRKALELLDWNRAGLDFFDVKNLTGLASWFRMQQLGDYRVEGGALVGPEGGRLVIRPGCDHLDPEPLRLMAEYRQGI